MLVLSEDPWRVVVVLDQHIRNMYGGYRGYLVQDTRCSSHFQTVLRGKESCSRSENCEIWPSILMKYNAYVVTRWSYDCGSWEVSD